MTSLRHIAWILLLFGFSHAHAESDFIEGLDYKQITPIGSAIRLPADKIEVREFFWYACSHCYSLEPAIQKWNKPKLAEFVLTPAMLGQGWVVHAYVYYTLEALGRLDDLHVRVFKAIHNEKRRLNSAEDFAQYFERLGEIKSDVFLKTFNSLSVRAKIKQAERARQRYALRSVPVFIVHDRYMVDMKSANGSSKRLFEIIDYLVALEAKNLPSNKQKTKASQKIKENQKTKTSQKSASTN